MDNCKLGLHPDPSNDGGEWPLPSGCKPACQMTLERSIFHLQDTISTTHKGCDQATKFFHYWRILLLLLSNKSFSSCLPREVGREVDGCIGICCRKMPPSYLPTHLVRTSQPVELCVLSSSRLEQALALQ